MSALLEDVQNILVSTPAAEVSFYAFIWGMLYTFNMGSFKRRKDKEHIPSASECRRMSDSPKVYFMPARSDLMLLAILRVLKEKKFAQLACAIKLQIPVYCLCLGYFPERCVAGR
jgi:hypothetical protein